MPYIVVLYLFKGNDLFYIRQKGRESSTKVKVLKGAEEAERIFVDFHASPTGAHCGQMKTIDAISRRFYWPGMSVDIKKWVCYISTGLSKEFSLLTTSTIFKFLEKKCVNLICITNMNQ